MKIKDFGKNMIPTMEVTCSYNLCEATVKDLRPVNVLVKPEGWTPKYFWRCPCCGHKSEIPAEKISPEFMEEIQLLTKERW